LQNQRIAGLDGLRALAAMAVFAVHYNQIVDVDVQFGEFDFYLLFANGELGVALFFVLSGLLLSLPYWRAILFKQAWPKLSTFVKHRLARILPAYYIALTLIIVLTNYWVFPAAWPDILLHYSFLFNYTEFSFFSINPSFWTLAVEMQFYLVLPVFFVALRHQSFGRAIGFFVILALGCYALHYMVVLAVDKAIPWPGSTILLWIKVNGAVVTQSLLAHLPHFIIGIITGGILLKKMADDTFKQVNRSGKVKSVFDVIFVLCLSTVVLLMGTGLGEWIQIPMGRYGLPVLPLVLAVLVYVTPFTYYAKWVLDSLVVRHLGKVSYGIYIYHFPILTFVDYKMSIYGWDARDDWAYLLIISSLLILLVANVSYYLVERPILRYAHKQQS
jgi:peptidoglycan/LPS O-acetylase OafA/YrhL